MPKFDFDLRLLDPQTELSALSRSIDTLEEQLAALTEARTEEVRARISAMSREDYEYGEAQLARQELEYEVEHTLPRVYRGALLLLIWSAYESGVQQVAEFLVQRIKPVLDISDMRGRTVLEKAKLYFSGVLGFQLFTDDDAKARIGELEKVRIAFAHATGRLASLRPPARKSIDAMIESGRLEEGLGWIILPKPYLLSAMALVDKELSGLIGRALSWDDEQKGESAGTS